MEDEMDKTCDTREENEKVNEWIFMFYWLSDMSERTLAAMDEINDNDNDKIFPCA
jgi:hypothetical protein